MLYEIWETASGNRVGAYASMSAALDVIHRSVEKHGASYADTLILAREDDDGETELLAEGADLVKMAMAEPAR
jgi:hypothetical protein